MAKLYGVGVGPGDFELMTLKAVRMIKECDIIAVPKSEQDVNIALTIAKGAVPEIESKDVLEVFMPMIRDKEKLMEYHKLAVDQIIELLENNKNIAFLTLGDPSIYSTYIYVHNQIVAKGYQAEIIPGVPSFCAVAARLNEGLTEASEALHIIPASYKGMEEALNLKGTKVLMKSGKSIGRVKSLMKEIEEEIDVKMVECCGMEGERVFTSIDDIDENASYFSILVLKDKVLKKG